MKAVVFSGTTEGRVFSRQLAALGAEVLVSVGDKIRDKDDLEDLILFDMGIDGLDPIRLCDVATV